MEKPGKKISGNLPQDDYVKVVRQDPHNPKLTGQIWLGGLLGKAPIVNGVEIAGGPQMFQLSLDGKGCT